MRNFIKIVESAQHEAPISEVARIVEAFVESVDDDVSNEHYMEHKDGYLHVFVGGYEADGFTEDYGRTLADRLGEHVRPHGWFVAKVQFDRYYSDADDEEHEDEEPQIMMFLDVFPLFGTPVRVPKTIYHVTPTAMVPKVRSQGLVPSKGGSDIIATENARIYVCLDQITVEEVAADLRKWRGKDLALTVLWISTEGLPNEFFEDVEMIEAAWTPDPIPASAIIHEEPV